MLNAAISVLLALAAAPASNKIISLLYRKEPEVLSYPEQIKERARFRLPLLFFGCIICFWQFDSSNVIPSAFSIAFFFFLLLITVTDLEQYVIFDSMVAALGIAGLLRAALAVFYPTAFTGLPVGMPLPPPTITGCLLTGLGAGALMLLLAVLTKGGIGGGDVKLLSAIGVWLGLQPTLRVLMLGFMLGGAAALLLLLSGQKKKQDFFAYGPCFTIAAVIVCLT